MKKRLLLSSLWCLTPLLAQIGPMQTTIGAKPTSTQVVLVPVSTTPTTIPLTVDSGASDGDLIDVSTTDPNVAISLITPAGVQININNGTSYGFDVSTYGSVTEGHMLIEFPSSPSSGAYTIQADSSAAAGTSAATVQYLSSSNVVAGALTNSSDYRVGDLVIGSLLLFDGSTPIQGATVTASATATVSLAATVGSFQLVSQQAASNTTTVYTYSAQLFNPGTAASLATAVASSSDPTITVQDSTLFFGNVAAGSAAASVNTFSVEVPTSSAFDPSSLTWQVSATTDPIPLTLTDSGPYDAASGDGLYTTFFTPTQLGQYSILVTASGTSSNGTPFVRSTATSFSVISPLAAGGI